MLSFQIPNMNCGHCLRTITEAVQTLDPAADVQADLPAHRVEIDTTVPREQVAAKLAEAGFAPA